MSGSVQRSGGASRWGGRDLDGELAERYVARVNLAGILLGVGLVYVVLLALWFVSRSTFSLLVAGPMGLTILFVSGFSQSGAFITGSRSDLPTVRSLRRRLRAGGPLSDEDVRLAEALARATLGARVRRGLVLGIAGGLAAAGAVAVWWGVSGGHPFRVAAYGLFAFAFVVQLVVVTVVAGRIGREAAHVSPYGRGD
ncbi:hypothetical protein [Lapillicoccus jejuensis]|uniref:Uncharacterized protein n=1 Tax=Lapillicoccus jejuensis TaxID=402171 RepID=A0A542DWD2_9MICO|nr:hypothetical protein [Lapillicoccus jejuensis]TQJ07403.1 hypothetical protein FB458_0464 [Lapillicoccus jejuensis]